jgi:hypothetical protein
MAWQSCASRGAAPEVRIQASLPVTIRAISGGAACASSPCARNCFLSLIRRRQTRFNEKPAEGRSRRASVNLTELFNPQNLTFKSAVKKFVAQCVSKPSMTKQSAFAVELAAAKSATLSTTHYFSYALDDLVFMGGFQS